MQDAPKHAFVYSRTLTAVKSAKALMPFLIVATCLHGQNSDIDRLVGAELKMTFPSIYFDHNSTEFADMPYTADSCFRYMAAHIRDIKSFAVWRDSAEEEALTKKRMEILKAGLYKYAPAASPRIVAMGQAQKIAQRTIREGAGGRQQQYLRALNSVIDVVKTRDAAEKKAGKRSHIDHPRVWCPRCWKNRRFTKEYRRLHVKPRPQ
jgi:hypothetical protein